MYASLALLALLARPGLAVAAAAAPAPALLERQTLLRPPFCGEAGLANCGSVCIRPGYSCCASGRGGCPPGSYCTATGCCPAGQVCRGAGGVDTEFLENTRVSTIVDVASTVVELPGFTTATTTTILLGGGGGGDVTFFTTISSATTVTSAETFTFVSATTDVVGGGVATETAAPPPPPAETPPPAVAPPAVAPPPPPDNATVVPQPPSPSPSPSILTGGAAPAEGGMGMARLGWSVMGQLLAAAFFL